jgi:8-oxo-dGTP pyrophosphatase MutT (NUDIX family)
MPQPDLAALQYAAESAGRRCCVGALVFDEQGRVFVPRRSPDARNLPGLWDIVGGHVEAGETLLDALRREVREETGWDVVGVPRLAFASEWTLPNEPDRPRREFDFVVDISGDLSRPQLAPDEHTDFRWVAGDELSIYDENRGEDQGLLRRIATSAFELRPSALRSPHATIFVHGQSAIEAQRVHWDPVMATLIAPHVTVAYPNEVPVLDVMVERVRRAATGAPSFSLRLAEVVHGGDPNDGVFVAVDDADKQWARLRSAIAGAAAAEVPPHVTLVHPRTSGLGAVAFDALRGRDHAATIAVRAVAVTAFDGGQWHTVETFALS